MVTNIDRRWFSCVNQEIVTVWLPCRRVSICQKRQACCERSRICISRCPSPHQSGESEPPGSLGVLRSRPECLRVSASLTTATGRVTRCLATLSQSPRSLSLSQRPFRQSWHISGSRPRPARAAAAPPTAAVAKWSREKLPARSHTFRTMMMGWFRTVGARITVFCSLRKLVL